jgi:hypothetical protein
MGPRNVARIDEAEVALGCTDPEFAHQGRLHVIDGGRIARESGA